MDGLRAPLSVAFTAADAAEWAQMQQVVLALLGTRYPNTIKNVKEPGLIKQLHSVADWLTCKYLGSHMAGTYLYNLIKANYKAANLPFITWHF